MIEVKFNIDGKDIAPIDIKDAATAASLDNLRQGIRLRLRDLRCPIHHKQPRVVISGPSWEQLNLDVEGCCEKLIKRAVAELK